jgi:hypothetical protein
MSSNIFKFRKILDKRICSGQLQYELEWLVDRSTTWVNSHDIFDYKELEKFDQAYTQIQRKQRDQRARIREYIKNNDEFFPQNKDQLRISADELFKLEFSELEESGYMFAEYANPALVR